MGFSSIYSLALISIALLHFFPVRSEVDSTPVFGVWHIGILGNYMEIVADQLSQFQRSSFNTEFTIVRILSTNTSRTDVEYLIRTHPAIEKLGSVLFAYGDEKEGQEWADTKSSWLARKLSKYLQDDAVVWFIHNKGVSHIRESKDVYEKVAEWRQMMMFFLFEKDWCYRALKEDFYDTCGSYIAHAVVRHYSGTFWMAHSRYLRTLPYAEMFWRSRTMGQRQAGEFWLLNSNLDEARVLCVHHPNLNLYKDHYERSRYENAHIGQGCKQPVKPEFLASLELPLIHQLQ